MTRCRGLLVALLPLCGFTSPAPACSVPVFRYAAERWLPDLYEVVVFHRGPLDGASKALVERLERAALPNGGFSPLDVASIDLAKIAEGEMKELWQSQHAAQLPWLVVRTPPHARKQDQVWAGPLNASSVDVLLISPVRHELAEAIRGGDSAVWVLLECGDKARDDAAARLLRDQLRKMQTDLVLPKLRADNPEDRIERGPNAPDLRLGFSMVRLSRTDPAEAPLVQMLLRVEDDLMKYNDQPMAFPVFGRGRALYALVGRGINRDTIEEACTFLIGPCGCEVKRLNPGSDLLITADWDGTFRSMPAGEKPVKTAPPVADTTSPNHPELIAMPQLVAVDTTPEPASDTGLFNLFLILVAGIAGTVTIALTMTRWLRA